MLDVSFEILENGDKVGTTDLRIPRPFESLQGWQQDKHV
jgi:hypothetical protein